ncbi:FAD-binding oxidoreductase [Roseateles asaccharophilus]|uniref:FAD/FMN-containing dehydrogenase n=1 Tax=Roseateles asaccharophilus TaxID=582607 RepID=A0ABU2AFI4_9BURK|nr:FAD-binding oxidoreductase [Roseateles asaccharophilus]MDR7335974.1 FAD/FMN-containing dehydrogenase [Roseateles asaccharophilus]
MERRQFLTLGGAAAIGLNLPGCGGGGGDSAVPPPPPAPPPASGVDWDALSRQLQGSLLRPGAIDFDRVARAANARYDSQQPQAIARCSGAADIAAALTFSQQQKLAFTTRSGGHSYLGASSGSALLIDVGAMDGVQLDGESVTVGAGAKLVDIYDTLISNGRCLSSGSCVTVGIAGITLGGGVGVLDRAHGLTCDALLSARVVTADGRQLDCSATQNADLFWALRGGGGGQVALVTSLTFQTHAVQPLVQFGATFTQAELPAVLSAWQAWPQTLPDTVWSQLALNGGSTYLWGIAIGDAAAVQPHWNGLLARIGRTPPDAMLQARTYRDVMLGSCATLSRAQCHLPSQNTSGVLGRVAMAASSDFFDTPLNTAGTTALGDALQQRRGSGRPGAALLNLMGGAIARVAPDATAFPHRRALFSAQYLAEYPAGSAAATLDEAATWANGMRATMAAWSSGGAYVNYLDGLLAKPAEAYYGANLARLRQVKQAWDPAGVFKALPAL